MDVREQTVWRATSTAKAKETAELLRDAGHEAKSKGRTLTVGHHPEAVDGVVAIVRHIDSDAERQNQ